MSIRITKQQKSEHEAFYQWVARSFPTTYLVGKDFTGLQLDKGDFGFRFPFGEATVLYYRPGNFRTRIWTPLDVEHSHHKAREENRITFEEMQAALAQRHSLAFTLDFWRVNIPHLIEFVGAGDNLRLRTQLAVILNYQIPAKP